MRIVLTVIFVLVSIALSVIVLAQQGADAGLGAIGGIGDSYWSKNKSRSMEGKLVQVTRILAVAFVVLAVVLNLNFEETEDRCSRAPVLFLSCIDSDKTKEKKIGY